jgi:hypothetical protein
MDEKFFSLSDLAREVGFIRTRQALYRLGLIPPVQRSPAGYRCLPKNTLIVCDLPAWFIPHIIQERLCVSVRQG